MKKVLAVLLALFLLLGSSTGVMARPGNAKKFIDNVVDPQLEVSTYAFDYEVPEDIIAGEEVGAKVTLRTDELGEDGYENVRLEFSVTSDALDNDDEVVFVGKDEDGKLYTFSLEDGDKAVWGPSAFSLEANYNETTPWTLKFPKPGDYEITFKLVNTEKSSTSSNYVILEEAKNLTVEPAVLKGFVSEKNISGTYYEVNGYRLTGNFDFEDFEGEFIVVEGYPDLSMSIYMVKTMYVTSLTPFDDGDQVTLNGKIQKLNVNNGRDYYTLEGVHLLETNDYDNDDFDRFYDDEVVVVEGEVDEDEQGIRVKEISVINDGNKDDDDDDDDENENERKGNGNSHGLLNALENHFRNRGNGNSNSMQRLMQLLQNRMGADELEEALKKMEIAVDYDTDDDDYKLLAKMHELKGKKYETYINGKKAKFDVPPMNKDGRTLAPFRAIAEALDAVVEWDANTNTVTVTKDGKEVILKIGSKKAFVNGEEVTLDVAPEVYENRTLIPLRFLAESLDADVEYYIEGSMIVVRNKTK